MDRERYQGGKVRDDFQIVSKVTRKLSISINGRIGERNEAGVASGCIIEVTLILELSFPSRLRIYTYKDCTSRDLEAFKETMFLR